MLQKVLLRLPQKLVADERGTTAIEYGIIVSLIFLAILSSVEAVSGVISALHDLVSAMLG
jgi:Flp pilus assembly pilin Flp